MKASRVWLVAVFVLFISSSLFAGEFVLSGGLKSQASSHGLKQRRHLIYLMAIPAKLWAFECLPVALLGWSRPSALPPNLANPE